MAPLRAPDAPGARARWLIKACGEPDQSGMGAHLAGGLFLLASGLMVGALPAQGKLHLPPGVLVAGTKVTVGLVDPSRPGEIVVVLLDGGGHPERIVVPVVLHLAARGRGSTTWRVPDWDGVRANAPGAGEVTRPIKPAR